MNELKPEDVMRALAWYEVVGKNIGSVTIPYDELQAIAALLREKDATIANYILQIAEMQKQIATQDRILTDFMKRKEIEADKDAEIERLKAHNKELDNLCDILHKKLDEGYAKFANEERAEAITEFAEKLKRFYSNLNGKTCGGSVEYHIDQIAKEMREKQ